MEALDNSGRCPDGLVQVVSFSQGLAGEEMQECVRDGRGGTDSSCQAIAHAARANSHDNSWIGGAWRRIRGMQVVQRPTSVVGSDDNPQPNPEGSFRRRWAPALASPVVESEGGMWLVCESSGPVGNELGVDVGMGALCVQRVKSTSPTTENGYENFTFSARISTRAMRTSMTQTTSTRMTRTPTRASCTSEHGT